MVTWFPGGVNAQPGTLQTGRLTEPGDICSTRDEKVVAIEWFDELVRLRFVDQDGSKVSYNLTS